MWKRPRLAFVTAPPAPAQPRVRAPRPPQQQQQEDDEPATVSISTAAATACLIPLQPPASADRDRKQEGAGPSISTTTTTMAAVTAAAAALAGAATAAALVVPPRLRGTNTDAATTTAATTNTSTTTRAPVYAFPRLPTPKPGDLVAWLPPPTVVQQQQQPSEEEAVQHPPMVALEPTLWEQAFMLSKYAPRLSTATGSGRRGNGGCDGGAPSYAAAAVPQAALGVVAYEGKWLFYSGGVIYMADAPMCRATQGALLVLRKAEGGGAVPGAVLARAMAYAGARYEVLGEGLREEEEQGEGNAKMWRLLAAAAGTEGNARYACWATSVAGAHLRTPIERGPLTHHAVDTGEGTVVHYSGGEIRLDDIHVLLAGKEALAPHRLGVVNGARLARATEQEVLSYLARLTSRLGERRYCVLTNNCETLSAWATCTKAAAPRHDAQPHTSAAAAHDDPLPRISSQVQAASLAVGSVVGGLGALIVGAVSAPALAVPVMVVSGAAVGSVAIYGAVASVAVSAQRELRALQAAEAAKERAGGGGEGGDDDHGYVMVDGAEGKEEG